VVDDQAELEVIRQIVGMRGSGMSTPKIVAELTASGFRTRKGTEFNAGYVWRILQREEEKANHAR